MPNITHELFREGNCVSAKIQVDGIFCGWVTILSSTDPKDESIITDFVEGRVTLQQAGEMIGRKYK